MPLSMIAASRVLFVSVSVVARPIKVSVLVGSVSVPVFEMVLMIGAVKVLFVSVSVVSRATSVLVPVGSVIVPLLDIVEITGAVKVLFVSVSVLVLATRVSVPFGTVIVPEVFRVRVPLPDIRLVAMFPESVLLVRVAVAEFLVASLVLSTLPRPTSALTRPVGELITGLVKVLLVRVSVEETVTTSTPSYSSLSPASTLRILSAPLAAFRQPIPSLLASLRIPVVDILLVRDLKYVDTRPKDVPKFTSAVRVKAPPALERAFPPTAIKKLVTLFPQLRSPTAGIV